jgi:hypothetical protein
MRRTPAHRKHRKRQGSGGTPTGAALEFGAVLREVLSLAVVGSAWSPGVAPAMPTPLPPPPGRLREPRGRASADGQTGLAPDGSAYLREVLGALDGRMAPFPGRRARGRAVAPGAEADVCGTGTVG